MIDWVGEPVHPCFFLCCPLLGPYIDMTVVVVVVVVGDKSMSNSSWISWKPKFQNGEIIPAMEKTQSNHWVTSGVLF